METHNVLIEQGITGLKKKIKYIQTISWVIFIAFIFAGYFGLQKAEQCERKDKLIQSQNDSIVKYHSIINELQDSLDASDVVSNVINKHQ